MLMGSIIMALDPPSLLFFISIDPLCSSIIFKTIAKPSPVPWLLLVTYGSNIFPRIFSGTPDQLSSNTITIVPFITLV